jgi:clan AA aspartic protease (TIGR02281 family)
VLKRFVCLCVLELVLSSIALAENICTVADPTRTPLNVRATPAGKLLSDVLHNGDNVSMYQTSSDARGKAWALVGRPGGSIFGRVFREYINCNRGESSEKTGVARTNMRRQIDGYAFEYHDEISSTVADLDSCISRCESSLNCAAYTFFSSRRLCRLMTRNDSVLERNSDAVSGFIQRAQVCTVADPTGTPLNVRATPAGQRLSVLYNGDNVSMYQTSNSGGQTWALVGKPGGSPYGWVFREYIKCEAPPSVERSASGGSISIPMQIEGGTYVVPVLINDAITLNFIVDSGAADVSIPADVVMTLMRTGTLKESDFQGKKTYVLADGSKVPSETFRIRSLKIGNQVLENVNGSVASVQGSLLLGQSFLGRFKSWSVDNTKHTLVLE